MSIFYRKIQVFFFCSRKLRKFQKNQRKLIVNSHSIRFYGKYFKRCIN